MQNKCYSELIELLSFEDRLAYLQEGQSVSDITLGGHRWLCQEFYRSKEWKNLRNKIIARDLGRDLAVDGYDIFGKVIIHHIVPLRIEDYLNRSSRLTDPENLITTTPMTHNAIHYGNSEYLTQVMPAIRTPNDTSPWRQHGR